MFAVRCVITLCLCSRILYSQVENQQCYNMMQFNSIRMAFYPHADNIADGFLDLAVANHFNYIVAEFRFNRCTYDSIYGNGDVYQSIKQQLISSLEKLDKKGLRLIPKIHVASSMANHWVVVQQQENKAIQMNLITGIGANNDTLTVGCPSLAPDESGFDKSFLDLLLIIKQAYQEASISYPLEFIHLGHDVPRFYNNCIIGGCTLLKSEPALQNKILEIKEFSVNDRQFIQQFNGNLTQAFQTLVVAELSRRIEHTDQIFGPRVKIMIYADMWDPQLYGSLDMVTYKSTYRYNDSKEVVGFTNTVQMIPRLNPYWNEGIITLPGLNSDQKKKFKEQIILIPINDSRRVTINDASWFYNAHVTFNYFSKNNFKFLYACELTEDQWPPDKDRLSQLKEFVKASKSYKLSCLGYEAVHSNNLWEPNLKPIEQSPCFKTMNTLFEENTNFLPSTSFNCKPGY